MKPLPWFVVFVTLVVSLSLFSQAQVAYSVAGIGKGAEKASPMAVDSNGDVVGVFQSPTEPKQSHAFYWNKANGIQDLGTLGGDDSAAFGVNASGQVVGQASTTAGGSDQAFLWTSGSPMVNLGNLGGTSSSASAINTSGQVVGEVELSDGFTNAFVWSASNGIEDLGVLPGGEQSGANAINDAGTVAGWSDNGTIDEAVTWTQSSGVVSLGITTNCGAAALGINNAGEVVGWFNNSASCGITSHGFSWTQNGGANDLGTLPGGQYSFAYGLNSTGQIVGTGDNASNSVVGLLWTANGTLYDLNTLIPANTPRMIVSANAINDAGQIVVNATETSGLGNFALLLTPLMSTTLTSSPNPSTDGQAVTFTATVTSIAGPPPDGEQVSFKAGATVLGTGTLTSGVATFTTSTLTTGSHRVNAIYSGDSIYATSKSAILVQVVDK
jgi:probable HAF family extracellular repeat protein